MERIPEQADVQKQEEKLLDEAGVLHGNYKRTESSDFISEKEARAIHDLLLRMEMEIWDLYSDCARTFHITDNEMFILLEIDENSISPISQAQIARNLRIPVQTVNSALAKLKEKGWIELVPLEGSRKIKAVRLSLQGQIECMPMLRKIHQCEEHAIIQMGSQDASQLILLLQKYIRQFRESITQTLAG